MKRKLRKIIRSRSVSTFIRFGYLSRGFLYGTIGVFAVLFAVGQSSKTLNTAGVVNFVNSLYLGRYLLLIFMIGLSGYIFWSGVRAFMDIIFEDEEKLHFFQRFGYIISLLSYTSIVVSIAAFILHLHKLSDGNDLNNLGKTLLYIPFGGILLLCVAIGSMIGGVLQMIRAITANKPLDFWSSENRPRFKIPFMIFAKIGITIRGFIFVLIGFFLLLAVLNTNPSEIKGMTEIFEVLKKIHYGSFLLASIGISLIFFGFYSALLSLWVKLP